MPQNKKVAVLGGGSFGTVLANIVAEKEYGARLWLRNAERAEEINTLHCNSAYLPGFALNANLHATTDLIEAVRDAAFVLMAVPSRSCREVARTVAKHVSADAILVSTTKGIEEPGFHLMSQVLAEEMPSLRLGVLSGPNLAKEISQRQLTGSVIASKDPGVIRAVQDLLGCRYFRLYASNDMYGVELGGALKNCYAIMSGMGAAMGLGQNTVSMLITRSLAEMSRFAVNMGADPMTFLGLSGVGDLIVTCMSPLSRNYRVGFELGQGKSLDVIVSELGQVAEGINTLKIVRHKADELGIYMPLVTGMYEIIFNRRNVGEVVEKLMLGEQSTDVEFATRREAH
jgi:glycerol-3-phosphate dehydrogenase (NAD(P)+)